MKPVGLKKRYRCVIFDWDGTLMDSVPRIVAAMQSAAQDLGIPVFSEEAVRNIVGLGLPEAISRLAPDLDKSESDALRQRYVAHFVDREENLPPPLLFPGVLSGVKQLVASGIQVGVATGKSEKGLLRALSHVPELSSLITSYQTADKTASKPDPLMLNRLLMEENASSDEAVMVGDSEYDMQMARRAGVLGIGVSWGVHSSTHLLGSGAFTVVTDFAQLVDLLLDA